MLEQMPAFWQFAITLWQNKEVEKLALTIQAEHGPVVYFLLGAWCGHIGQPFDEALAQKIAELVEPVETELRMLRSKRNDLEGEEKQVILQQELALEKALYEKLSGLCNASKNTQLNQEQTVLTWWQHWFPSATTKALHQWKQLLAA